MTELNGPAEQTRDDERLAVALHEAATPRTRGTGRGMSENWKFAIVIIFVLLYAPFMVWVALNPQWP